MNLDETVGLKFFGQCRNARSEQVGTRRANKQYIISLSLYRDHLGRINENNTSLHLDCDPGGLRYEIPQSQDCLHQDSIRFTVVFLHRHIRTVVGSDPWKWISNCFANIFLEGLVRVGDAHVSIYLVVYGFAFSIPSYRIKPAKGAI